MAYLLLIYTFLVAYLAEKVYLCLFCAALLGRILLTYREQRLQPGRGEAHVVFSPPPGSGHSWVSAIPQKERARFVLPARGPDCWQPEPAAKDEASQHPGDCKYATHLFILVS